MMCRPPWNPEKFKNKIESLKIDLYELAENINKPKVEVVLWKSGQLIPEEKDIRKLEEYFMVEQDYFYGFDVCNCYFTKQENNFEHFNYCPYCGIKLR